MLFYFFDKCHFPRSIKGSDNDVLDPDVDLENRYWEADDLKKSSPKESLDGFLFYIKQDTARSLGEIPGKPKEHLELEDVGIGYFHALYEVTLIYFKLGQYDNMLVYLRKLLHFLPQVTRNERQKAINNDIEPIYEFDKDVLDLTDLKVSKNNIKTSTGFDYELKSDLEGKDFT